MQSHLNIITIVTTVWGYIYAYHSVGHLFKGCIHLYFVTLQTLLRLYTFILCCPTNFAKKKQVLYIDEILSSLFLIGHFFCIQPLWFKVETWAFTNANGFQHNYTNMYIYDCKIKAGDKVNRKKLTFIKCVLIINSGFFFCQTWMNILLL